MKDNFKRDLCTFGALTEEVNSIYNGVDITFKKPLETKVTISSFELLAEVDVSVGGYFDSTIQIRNYGDTLPCYLGDTDISNDVPYDLMTKIVEENQ